ncbi:hypothetical protein EDB89DRAFT_2075176 [Lactarius sanguifluus]|nr:hypothetical protein EDB89DRAFT_2075176 [Lactarius sanguifluus]
MPTFRTTASSTLAAFVALSSIVPLSYAQSQLPACAAPCAASAAATAGCSLTDPACICSSDPFLLAYHTCIYQPENCFNDGSADIRPAISFYVDVCDDDGPGFPTLAPSFTRFTTGSSASSISSIVLTLPPPVLPTLTSTPSSTSASTQTVSLPPTNAAASLPVHARAAAALMAGGVGALVAVAM